MVFDGRLSKFAWLSLEDSFFYIRGRLPRLIIQLAQDTVKILFKAFFIPLDILAVVLAVGEAVPFAGVASVPKSWIRLMMGSLD